MHIGLVVCRNSINKPLLVLGKKTEKEKNILNNSCILCLPWMFLPNLKQIQWNRTVHNTLFLHQLCIHNVWPEKTKFLFAHRNTATLSGASSLEKRCLLWKGSFWYHFSALNHTFSYNQKSTKEFCDVAKVLYQQNSANLQYIGNICS